MPEPDPVTDVSGILRVHFCPDGAVNQPCGRTLDVTPL